MNGNLQVSAADLFLLESWNTSSTQGDDDQLTEISSCYVRLPFPDRYVYIQRANDAGISKARDLSQADQELLNRPRKPQERDKVDMIWLRTHYGQGTDAAFTAFMGTRPDETEIPVFQNEDLYDYGDKSGWSRIFTRLPQILDPYKVSPESYEHKKREAREECIEAERRDAEDVEEQGGDPEEDGTYWMELYSAYHYEAKVVMMFVVDEETLLAAAEDLGAARVLTVWFDEMGRVVRQTRLTAQETWNVEGLEMTMGGALQEHGEWTRAEPGDAYDWDGPLGPPFGGDVGDEP